MKKGIITFILGISLLLGSKIINPDIAYAYDKTNYQYSNGYYYVDNTDKHSTDNHITLNVLIEKDSILEGKFLYDFKCISNNFTDSESYDNYGYNLMRYENKFDNISKDNITVTDFGEIITFKFCVENGTSIFATNDYANNIVTLTPNNNSPLVNSLDYSSLEAYKKSIREYPIELNNQSLNLFCIYGSDSFINMNIKNLVNSIGTNTGGAVGETQEKNNTKKELENVLSNSNLTDNKDTDELIQNLTEDINNDNNTEYLPTNSDTVSIDTVTINNSSEKQSRTVIKKTNIKYYILGLLGFLAVIIFFVAKKKRG